MERKFIKFTFIFFITFSITKSFPHKLNKTNVNESVITPVEIGQIVPDLNLGQIINHSTLNSAKISDFRGKILVLDFWTEWCSICISQFPKLKDLQTKYSDKVTILPVGFDVQYDGAIKEFIYKIKGTKKELKLPTAVQGIKDTALMKAFPFNGVPHLVWIDENGFYLGSSSSISEKQILMVLGGNKSLLKKTIIKKTAPIPFMLPTSFTNKGLVASVFSGYIDSLKSYAIMGQQYDTSFMYLGELNKTLYDYYKFGYSEEIPDLLSLFGSKFIIADSTIKSRYKDFSDPHEDKNAFQNESLFSYELIMPKVANGSLLKKKLISDFDRQFNIESKVEKKITSLLILKPSVDSLACISETTMQLGMDFYEEDGSWKMTGIDMNYLANFLNVKYASLPIIKSELTAKCRFNVKLPRIIRDSDQLKSLLSSQGIEIVNEYRNIPILFLKEKPN